MNRAELKNHNIFQFLLSIFIIILVCFIVSFAFFRLDLTQEKRYTLSDASKQKLLSLPGEVLVKVYLEGNMPIGFKKLNRSVHEMLDEFRVYAKENIQYQFIDPYSGNNLKAIEALKGELKGKGLQPTSIKMKDAKGGYSEKEIMPGALISFNGIEISVNLLSNNPGLTAEENLNNSVQQLEYNLISGIQSITNDKLEKIAFLEGHGELDQYQVGDITRELANYYQVDRGSIRSNINALDAYKCIIIAKPQSSFSEEDKFVLDQYLMNGGKILWLIDPVSLNYDSIAKGNTFTGISQLNIDDQLFRYGVRINPVLIQDVQCGLLPVNTSSQSTQPKFIPAPWLYYPLLSGSDYHAVSRNLSLIKSEYSSYIDTLEGNSAIHKSVLLQSSRFTSVRSMPSFISLAEIRQRPKREDFNKSFLPTAVLLEGQFVSVFKNRPLSNLKINGTYQFKDKGIDTKMLVVADGDIIRNEVRETPEGILISPLGLDKYTSQTFGNKEFILNAVNYLTEENGLMKLRSREVKLRLLDKVRLADDRLFWQMINVVGPLLIVVLAGVAFSFVRKRRNEN